MSWKWHCPYCGEEYKIKSEQLGKKYRCIMCKEVFVVPNAEQLRLANTVNCPTCLAHVSPKADRCPHCGGKMPLKVSFFKKLFCGLLMLVGAVFLIAGVICIVDPRYDTMHDSYEYLDSQGRIQTRELRRYRNEGNSHLGIGIVLSGFGLILIFGAGAYRRRR